MTFRVVMSDVVNCNAVSGCERSCFFFFLFFKCTVVIWQVMTCDCLKCKLVSWALDIWHV